MSSASGLFNRRVLTMLIGMLVVVSALACASAPARAAAQRACSSYPAPGQLAPARAAVPAVIAHSYALFHERRTASDELRLGKLASPLQASGIIASSIRYLGRTPTGYKLYAIAARHYTPFKIAPLRCFSPPERWVERDLLPTLTRDYKHRAICIAETGVSAVDGTPLENCGPPQSIATAMVATSAMPLLGLAPNSVRSVEAAYLSSPARIIPVHHNFYEITGDASAVTPCGVTWLQASGNTPAPTFNGCDYETSELPEYQDYKAYVTAKLNVVEDDLSTLASALSANNLQSAESAWLAAHLAWLSIGQDDKQYGAFGDLGNSIDGTSAGLAGGVLNPDFSGFHRIELDLWGEADISSAATDTSALQGLLHKLITTPLGLDLPATVQGVANWLLRPHEILEDAERDTLTGDDDYGSGSGADGITADVSAVKEDLELLAPTVDLLAPKLEATIGAELTKVDAAAEAAYVGGHWTAISALTQSARERLNAAVGAAVETLSRIPDLLTSTGAAAPPT